MRGGYYQGGSWSESMNCLVRQLGGTCKSEGMDSIDKQAV